MKKIITLSLSLFLLASLHAQTKITKAGIQGKWNLAAMEVPNAIYYDIEKDSLALGELVKAQATTEDMQKAVVMMMKQQLSIFTKAYFQFSADGAVEMLGGMAGGALQKGTYTVDEENSTITAIGDPTKEAEKVTMKASMQQEKLLITVRQPQGEMTMILKKAKS
ncbi:MAG: hypothetical protein JWQ78_2238 [Sediminibacterium sp.]|nr:hypothetical protein [Sediminibacterium sp.]